MTDKLRGNNLTNKVATHRGAQTIKEKYQDIIYTILDKPEFFLLVG